MGYPCGVGPAQPEKTGLLTPVDGSRDVPAGQEREGRESAPFRGGEAERSEAWGLLEAYPHAEADGVRTVRPARVLRHMAHTCGRRNFLRCGG